MWVWCSPVRRSCFLFLSIALIIPLSFAAGVSDEESDHHRSIYMSLADHEREQSLYVKWKESISKRVLVATTDYEGDYASIANTVSPPPPPPPLKRRRSLLQDYGPEHNQGPTPKPPRRKQL